MPCYTPEPTQEELAEWARQKREQQKRDGRYDLAATREELAQWLCDTLRGNPHHHDMLLWWEAHKKHADRDRIDAAAKSGEVRYKIKL